MSDISTGDIKEAGDTGIPALLSFWAPLLWVMAGVVQPSVSGLCQTLRRARSKLSISQSCQVLLLEVLLRAVSVPLSYQPQVLGHALSSQPGGQDLCDILCFSGSLGVWRGSTRWTEPQRPAARARATQRWCSVSGVAAAVCPWVGSPQLRSGHVMLLEEGWIYL